MENEQYKNLISQFIESHQQLEEALNVISSYNKSVASFNLKMDALLPEVEKSNSLPYNEFVGALSSTMNLISENNAVILKSISEIDSKLSKLQLEFSKFNFSYMQKLDEISSGLDLLLEKSNNADTDEATEEVAEI